MTAEEAAEAGKGLTFEKVWAALMETRETIERMARAREAWEREAREREQEAREREREAREVWEAREQEAREAREREAREAREQEREAREREREAREREREAREREAREAWEAREREAREAREAWEARAREAREAWEAREREAREAWEAREREARETREREREAREREREAREREREAREAREQEAREKSSREVNEQINKTAKEVAKLSKNMGGLNRSMGELIETLIAARLWKKFSNYEYKLKRAYQRIPVYDENSVDRTDIDILLVDTEWAMAVEVKREADRKDVDHHIKRMGLILRYPPAEVRGKKLLGALAGGVVPPDVREYAYGAGFFVLELRGESVRLAPPPKGFLPKQWVAAGAEYPH
jgi:hypothetical protein